MRGRNTLPKFFQESVLKISDAEHGKTSLQKLISYWDRLQGADLIKTSMYKMQGTVLEKNWWGEFFDVTQLPNEDVENSRIASCHVKYSSLNIFLVLHSDENQKKLTYTINITKDELSFISANSLEYIEMLKKQHREFKRRFEDDVDIDCTSLLGHMYSFSQKKSS